MGGREERKRERRVVSRVESPHLQEEEGRSEREGGREGERERGREGEREMGIG